MGAGSFQNLHQNTDKNGQIKFDPIIRHVAAISCGIVDGEPKLDLNYQEDSAAETDELCYG